MEKETHCPKCQAVNQVIAGKIYCHQCGWLIADMTPPEQQPTSFGIAITVISSLFGTLAVIAVIIAFLMILAPNWMIAHLPFLSFFLK